MILHYNLTLHNCSNNFNIISLETNDFNTSISGIEVKYSTSKADNQQNLESMKRLSQQRGEQKKTESETIKKAKIAGNYTVKICIKS